MRDPVENPRQKSILRDRDQAASDVKPIKPISGSDPAVLGSFLADTALYVHATAYLKGRILQDEGQEYLGWPTLGGAWRTAAPALPLTACP
jgi:hypothetical protein